MLANLIKQKMLDCLNPRREPGIYILLCLHLVVQDVSKFPCFDSVLVLNGHSGMKNHFHLFRIFECLKYLESKSLIQVLISQQNFFYHRPRQQLGQNQG